MSDIADRVCRIEARLSAIEATFMERAHVLGGLDAEMDLVIAARYRWFDALANQRLVPEDFDRRASAAEALGNAIDQRIQAAQEDAMGGPNVD